MDEKLTDKQRAYLLDLAGQIDAIERAGRRRNTIAEHPYCFTDDKIDTAKIDAMSKRRASQVIEDMQYAVAQIPHLGGVR